MSKTVIQNKFDGGFAEDIRTTATDQCESSLNFDVFTNPHRLIPYGDSIAETSDTPAITASQISDINISLIGSSYYFTGIGFESAISSKANFFTKSALTNGGTLNWETKAISASGAFQQGSGVVYKNKMYALCWSGTVYTLFRYDGAGTVTSCGTITDSSLFRARPFVHPLDNKLYIVTGNTISYYDGTNNIGTSVATSYSVSTILPTGFETTSITDYGSYLAIAMRPLRGTGNSVVYLWGRDATLNTLQGNVDFGEGNLLILENLDNNLFAVIQPQSLLNGNVSFTTITNKLIIRKYSGGAVEDMKSITLSVTSTAQLLKVKKSNRLYFGFSSDDCVYVFGKNKEGQYILTKDRYYFNGTTISSLYGLSMIGDILWRSFIAVSGSLATLMRSKVNALGETITYASTSVYKTTINPSMPIVDRTQLKQLEAVQVTYVGKANGTIALKYSADGGAMTTIISEGTTATTEGKEATNESDGTVLASGNEFQFQIESTGGVEILEIKYRYSILNSTI